MAAERHVMGLGHEVRFVVVPLCDIEGPGLRTPGHCGTEASKFSYAVR